MSNRSTTLLSLLFNHSPYLLPFAIFIGVVAGGLYSLIIPFVLSGIDSNSSNLTENVSYFGISIATLYFCIVSVILVSKAFSVILVNNIAKSAAADLKISIAKKINAMNIGDVEKIGFSKLINILNDDINNITVASVAIPMLLVSTVTVIGMLTYLAFLDIRMFLLVIAALVIGVLIFQIPVRMASGNYRRSRAVKDDIQEGVRGLVMGAYELKLDDRKSKSYLFEEIETPQKKSVRLEKIGDAIIHLAGSSSDLLSLFVIGFIVFILPVYIDSTAGKITGVVMALLYIAGPVAHILGVMGQLQVGRISLARIQELDAYSEEKISHSQSLDEFDGWNSLFIKNVGYQYPQVGGEVPFSISDINLEFKKGEVVFIVGGNGSGKTTLSKILSLHLRPLHGGLFFDEIKITSKNLQSARSLVGVIYSNYFLFKKIYKNNEHISSEKINFYIKKLGLEGKTEYKNGYFSTIKLSDGQRRRLALLVALVEDRDIYVFDEWAADQDPGFKKLFYETILPEFKLWDKLVIVITHDDRYFDCADRVIHMEDGRIKCQQQNQIKQIKEDRAQLLEATV